MTAAEQIVDRFDSYTPAQHVEFIDAARQRTEAKTAARRERAEKAAARLRNAEVGGPS